MSRLNRPRRFFLLTTYSLLLITLLSGCVTIFNPATGKKEALWIDTQEEVALGTDLDSQMRKKLVLMTDAAMFSRLERIGKRISAVSDRQDLTYHFRVVKDEEFNAFALPGGFVYVNSGLMKAASDDELAGVVGHEIGHIAAKHSVKRLQSAMGTQLVLALALGISGKQTSVDALNIIFNLINLGYSRNDELFADKLGVRYSSRAKFDPYGMVTFFEKLKQQSGASHLKPVFFSSHPAIDERIRLAKDEIAVIREKR